ncbi:MAG TPA: glycosyltransferase family 4 protein [Nanoarchaeota archaeon]|nr:glycosyltransferase family 4 protein [Nanoarchaeota archaeon]
MKLGFLLSTFYPMSGGRESLTFNLARELVKNGHEVHVFTSLLPGTGKEQVVEGIRIHRTRTWFRYKYYLEFNPGWIRNVMKYRLDVLHVQSFGFIMADIAVVLKKLFTHTKLVNSPLGPFMALEKYPLWQELMKKAYLFLEKPVNRLYDSVIQINPEQWRWITKCGVKKEKIFLLVPGIPAELFALQKHERFAVKWGLKGKLVISYVGRIQKYKGLDQVIAVLPDILKKHRNVVFLAMGKDAGDMDRLKKMATDLGVAGNVVFTGPVTEDEKLQGLDISQIFVFPSEWEAFGIAIIEAMARGNAVVSTKTEGGRYLIKDGVNGYLYDYRDTDALKKCLIRLLDDEKSRKLIISNNLKKSRAFSIEKIAGDMEKLYMPLMRVKD